METDKDLEVSFQELAEELDASLDRFQEILNIIHKNAEKYSPRNAFDEKCTDFCPSTHHCRCKCCFIKNVQENSDTSGYWTDMIMDISYKLKNLADHGDEYGN
jgi:hypothetical protein